MIFLTRLHFVYGRKTINLLVQQWAVHVILPNSTYDLVAQFYSLFSDCHADGVWFLIFPFHTMFFGSRKPNFEDLRLIVPNKYYWKPCFAYNFYFFNNISYDVIYSISFQKYSWKVKSCFLNTWNLKTESRRKALKAGWDFFRQGRSHSHAGWLFVEAEYCFQTIFDIYFQRKWWVDIFVSDPGVSVVVDEIVQFIWHVNCNFEHLFLSHFQIYLFLRIFYSPKERVLHTFCYILEIPIADIWLNV